MMKKHRSLWVIIFVYLLANAVIFVFSLYLTGGNFVYALDDPYIHMSMANNLLNHGHWAINQMDFTSASSSPLWVLIISGTYFFSGVNTAIPLILNILFQILSIIIVYYILKNYGISKYLIPFIFAFVFITPLPAILFTGMEHSAQVVFALLFVFYGIKLITANDKKDENFKLLLLFTPVFTALRYEDMIPVLIICVLLLARRKFLYALLILLPGLLPIVIYGLLSTSHGWMAVPNTILLKSTPPDYSVTGLVRFSFKAFSNITEPHLFVVLIICSFLYVFNFKREKSFWDGKQIFLLVVALSILINMSLIEYHQNGAFYRYEAYLMALGTIAISVCVYDLIPGFLALLRVKNNSKYVVLILLLIVLSPLVIRAFTAFGIPHATREYYVQQYQMAQFVKLYGKDMNVALNDIGMVGYYSNNKVIDLWGVGNIEVAKQRLNGTFSTSSIAGLTRKENIRLAILYETWFEAYGGFPSSWKKLAEWTMTDYNYFLGHSTVSIYSTNPAEEIYLKEKLKEFSLQLPRTVICKLY